MTGSSRKAPRGTGSHAGGHDTRPRVETGGRVAAVAPGSAAAEAGIRPGDLLLAVDDRRVADVIDYRFHLEPGRCRLTVMRDGRRLHLALESEGEDPGIEFVTPLFDGTRTCACRCCFCFVEQLPAGLRSSLYLKDDDFRLSFLHGNFITLNNLAGGDLDRIAAQRLSPLYVSVHATDAAVRAALMGVSERAAARGLSRLARLGEAGIEVHAQVVLCPGVNDGAVLERTIEELESAYPAVASVGVVPVALSDAAAGAAGGGVHLRRVTGADAEEVLKVVGRFQAERRRAGAPGFVYAADEFYLLAGEQLPEPAAYDDFPQFENGIGITAAFTAATSGLEAQLPPAARHGRRVFLLSGVLAADTVASACRRLDRGRARPPRYRALVVENRVFGRHVTVTGLLGGKEVLDTARRAGLGDGDLLLVPRSCLGAGDTPRFIDGVTPAEISEALSCPVLPLRLD